MKLFDGSWLCPFCLTKNYCEGPHIDEKYMKSFSELMYYSKEDHALTALEEIEKYERENNVNLASLKHIVWQKIMERDR